MKIIPLEGPLEKFLNFITCSKKTNKVGNINDIDDEAKKPMDLDRSKDKNELENLRNEAHLNNDVKKASSSKKVPTVQELLRKTSKHINSRQTSNRMRQKSQQ
jgi:hypothetical protein